MPYVRPVFRGALTRVTEVTCRMPRGVRGPEHHAEAPEIVLPRQGAVTLHRGRRATTADPSTAVVFRGRYRLSHPTDCGDRSLAIRLAPDLHEEAIGEAHVLQPSHRLRVSMAARAVRDEETALLLVAAIADAPVLRATPRIEQVRELLAAQPTERWTLSRIGRTVHCSPYHLARQFRAATGQTIAGYLLGLRLALALDRIERGEDDLARLAAELGFSGHSHLTERFRHAYGSTPSEVRKILTARRARLS